MDSFNFSEAKKRLICKERDIIFGKTLRLMPRFPMLDDFLRKKTRLAWLEFFLLKTWMRFLDLITIYISITYLILVFPEYSAYFLPFNSFLFWILSPSSCFFFPLHFFLGFRDQFIVLLIILFISFLEIFGFFHYSGFSGQSSSWFLQVQVFYHFYSSSGPFWFQWVLFRLFLVRSFDKLDSGHWFYSRLSGFFLKKFPLRTYLWLLGPLSEVLFFG
jgi:hypothetical protein